MLALSPALVAALPALTARGDAEDVFPFLFALGFWGVVMGFLFLAALAIQAYVCWMLARGLERLPARHHQISPGLVWLLLVPCFSTVWTFFVYPAVARSYRAWFEEQGQREHGDCGEGIGMAYCVATVACWIPCLGSFAVTIALVLLVLFLVRIHELGQRVPAGAA